MSHDTDVIEGLITLINSTLPTYRAVDGYESIDSLDGGELKRQPVAMVFNPSMISETVQYQQRQETWTYRVFLIRAPNELRDTSEGLQLRADVAALKVAIDGDAPLDVLTDDIKLGAQDLHEEGKTYTLADLIVEDVTVTN